jgi:hypothetical protein
MQQRYFELAGLRFLVRVPDGISWPESQRLMNFRAEPGPCDLECVLSLVDRLDPPVGQLCHQEASTKVYMAPGLHLRYKGAVSAPDGGYMRILRQGNRSDIQILASAVPHGLTSEVIVSSMEAIHHITAAGGFLLHASWIRYRDKAILFTAPSGVGKSTQAALWETLRGAELMNGDRAAVFPTEQGIQVRGIPFCGTSGVSKNVTLPLAAVVCLAQAPKTTITRLTGAKAFRQLWEGCCINTWNQEDMERCAQAVSDTVSQVPIFYLACTPDESAVLALEKEGVF